MPGLEEAEVEAACAIGWAGWHGEGHGQVASLERYFDRVCSRTDDLLGEPGAARVFLDWYDAAPRSVMRGMLLREIDRVVENDDAAMADHAAALGERFIVEGHVKEARRPVGAERAADLHRAHRAA